MPKISINTINDRFIKTLEVPQNTVHKIYWDGKTTGFGVRITKSGKVSFVLRYIINGRERKYTIGEYPTHSALSARETAIKLKGEVAKGFDPLEKRITDYNAYTVNELIEEYLQKMKGKLRENTTSMYKTMHSKHISGKIGKQKVNIVKRREIEVLHNTLLNTPYIANRILAMLSVVFGYAISHGMITHNPCFEIARYTEEKRERYLTKQEIEDILTALNTSPYIMEVNAIKLLLLTGSRKSEVLQAKWEQFNFDEGIWLKPSNSTKQKRPSLIPLNTFAIAILLEMKKSINKSNTHIISTNEYLFYNTKTKKPLQDIKRFWATICKTAEIENLHMHDLRHTFASILANNGIDLHQTGKLLGHSNSRTTERYSHLHNNTLRNASELVGGVVMGGGV
ncbi:MAG: integrase [Candidatus Deianiraeaceae bacterium]|jgi:integrase